MTAYDIEIDNISITTGKNIIINNLSLKVPPGERVLIKGASGSGKTTLFKAIMGFIMPKKGSIRVKKIPVKPENVKLIRQYIAYMPQNINVFSGTVEEEVTEIFKTKINKKGFSLDNLIDILSILDLGNNVLSKSWYELSGGEKQRIILAITILLDRDIMLLDEPTSALDDRLKEKAVDLCSKLNKTIIVISHDEVWNNLDNLRILHIKGI